MIATIAAGLLRRADTGAIAAEPSRSGAPEPLHALTALRFLAAAYVLTFHFEAFYFHDYSRVDPILMGYAGVTFFFLLSGFVLAHTYAGADLRAPGVLAGFRRARFARIAPVYLLSLVLSVPFLLAWAMKSAAPLRELLLSGLVLAPLGLQAWLPGAACSLNCPSWAISVEVFFYALFPLLLPLVLRRPLLSAGGTLVLWLACGLLATAVWHAYGADASLVDPSAAGTGPVLAAQFVKFFPALRLPEFLGGLLLYVLWRRVRIPGPVLAAMAAAAVGSLSLLLPVLPAPVSHNGLTALFWAPVILLAAGMRRGPLVSRPLVVLGRIAFELYLLHTPVYAGLHVLDRRLLGGAAAATYPWATAVTATLLTLALSGLVYVTVSQPLRRALLKGSLVGDLRAALAARLRPGPRALSVPN